MEMTAWGGGKFCDILPLKLRFVKNLLVIFQSLHGYLPIVPKGMEFVKVALLSDTVKKSKACSKMLPQSFIIHGE